MCGEAEFKLYAGVIVIDNGRIRFKVQDWRTMVCLMVLRGQLQGIIRERVRKPDGHGEGSGIGEEGAWWMDVFRTVFTREK